MPLKQYIILKRAVEIEAIVSRRLKIYDLNRAFHGPEQLFRQLEKEMLTLLHGSSDKAKMVSNISWKKDSDWKSRLQKFRV